MIFDHKFSGNFDFDHLSSISELLIIVLYVRHLLFVRQCIRVLEPLENFKKILDNEKFQENSYQILVNTTQNFNKIFISCTYVNSSN